MTQPIIVTPFALLSFDKRRNLPDMTAISQGATESRCKTVVTLRWA
jgi:hypothetical protein